MVGKARAVPATPEVPASVRAQLLATEHWSLLASRSATQSEMLSRISILLTLVSAGLVSLALIGQATGFSDAFAMFYVAVLAIVNVVGILTQLRVLNVGMEDAGYVLAMNRLRAGYVDLDPGVARYLMTSTHDDMAGLGQTYYFLGRRSDLRRRLFHRLRNSGQPDVLRDVEDLRVPLPLPVGSWRIVATTRD